MKAAKSYISHKSGLTFKYNNVYITTHKTSNDMDLDLYYFIAVTHVKIIIF